MGIKLRNRKSELNRMIFKKIFWKITIKYKIFMDI